MRADPFALQERARTQRSTREKPSGTAGASREDRSSKKVIDLFAQKGAK
jgi:hypothetical protein